MYIWLDIQSVNAPKRERAEPPCHNCISHKRNNLTGHWNSIRDDSGKQIRSPDSNPDSDKPHSGFNSVTISQPLSGTPIREKIMPTTNSDGHQFGTYVTLIRGFGPLTPSHGD